VAAPSPSVAQERAWLVPFPTERSQGARGEGGRVIPGESPPGRAFGAPDVKLRGKGRESRSSLTKSWIPFPRIANAILAGNDTALTSDR